jgi:hypothetical protein
MMTEEMKEKRAKLGALTADARKIREKWVNHYSEIGDEKNAMRWASRTLNSIIIESFYKDSENDDFRTFNEWKREGYKVKKGSKGFVVWGRPLSEQKAEQGQEASDEESTFFPISHVFSNAQVELMKEEAAA